MWRAFLSRHCLAGGLIAEHLCDLILSANVQVGGELQSVFVEKVSCGRSHAAVLASPMDRQKGRPQVHSCPTRAYQNWLPFTGALTVLSVFISLCRGTACEFQASLTCAHRVILSSTKHFQMGNCQSSKVNLRSSLTKITTFGIFAMFGILKTFNLVAKCTDCWQHVAPVSDPAVNIEMI